MEQSKPEQLEAWLYGLYGAAKGVKEHYLKPALSEQPIWAFMLCGAIGGVAISKTIEHYSPS